MYLKICFSFASVTRVSELMNGIRKTQADQPEEIAPKPPKPNPKLLYRLSDKEILEGVSTAVF